MFNIKHFRPAESWDAPFTLDFRETKLSISYTNGKRKAKTEEKKKRLEFSGGKLERSKHPQNIRFSK